MKGTSMSFLQSDYISATRMVHVHFCKSEGDLMTLGMVEMA